ncbi:glycosyltransferase [Psychrobacter sp. FBL11]|uniref:Glycosyltransferase n=1 Tax=Psychrobacter saeujeotis TaxID=3143436 RepID=A0ABU9X8F2_9GAMM|nr:glycosyltransferase [uncultured Psychrobacter sp.]
MLNNKISKDKVVLSINSLQGAGAERFVLTIGAAFHKLGFDVHILRFNSKVEFTLDGNLTYHLIEYDRYRVLPKGRFRDMVLAKTVDRYIRKNITNPVLILSNLERSDNIFSYSKLPNIVYVIHNTLSLLHKFEQTKKTKGRKDSFKSIYSKNPCVCVSNGVKEDFIKQFGNITQVTAIHNPTDREVVQKQASAFVPEYQNYIIHVGSFKEAKRHDLLLQAYAQTDQSLPLLLLGQGKDQIEIERLIRELGLADNVKLLGFCENPYPYIKNAKFKILTSDWEGCPMVIPEALALGVPIISTDCESGPREVLPEKNLMPVNDVNAIANKLKLAMQDPQQFFAEFDESLLPVVAAEKYLDVVKYKN